MRNKIIFTIAFGLLVLPLTASAYVFLEPLPGLAKEVQGPTVLSDYLTWLFRFALAAAAFLAVMRISLGGIYIIMGGASESAQTEGRKKIEVALWGLLLAVSSVLILATINPALVSTGLKIPPAEMKNVTTPQTQPPSGPVGVPNPSSSCKTQSPDNQNIITPRSCKSTVSGCGSTETDIGKLDCLNTQVCCEGATRNI